MSVSHWQIAPDEIRLAIAELDLDGKLLAANRQCCEWLGWPAGKIPAVSFNTVFAPGNPTEESAQRSRLLSGEIAAYSSQGSIGLGGGKSVPAKVDFGLAADKRSLFAVLSDLTAVSTAEAALRESETARHELARRLTTAQEKERTRIARELHDDIGQALAILRIQMLRAGQPVSGMIGRRHPTIPQLCDSLKSLAEKVSRISHQLHSSELEYLGLAIAVQSHCREFSEKYKIPVECTCEGIPENLDSLLALSLLRIVQEALYNAGKYSKATSIQVALEVSRTDLSLLVSDDGVGFDLDEAKLAAGLGLISMRERVHLAGGEFKIESQPGEGTCIMARIPLDDAGGALNPAD